MGLNEVLEIVTGCIVSGSVRTTPREEEVESNRGDIICLHIEND